jgi:hypothetical protein
MGGCRDRAPKRWDGYACCVERYELAQHDYRHAFATARLRNKTAPACVVEVTHTPSYSCRSAERSSCLSANVSLLSTTATYMNYPLLIGAPSQVANYTPRQCNFFVSDSLLCFAIHLLWLAHILFKFLGIGSLLRATTESRDLPIIASSPTKNEHELNLRELLLFS